MSDLVETRVAASVVPECDWPITNCYVDAWLLVLGAWGLDPIAGLGVTVTQDYEGDQFTFFKYLHEDLERLYGVITAELSIWGALEDQIAEQVRLGRLLLIEADGYYLPDTRATSYRSQHTKTTIGIDTIDPAKGRLTYFHNVGHYELAGEDYAGVFHKLPQQRQADDVLPPYVEFVKRRWPPLRGVALIETAVDLMQRHLRRRPDDNPIRRYRAEFARHMDWLMEHPQMFHEYAFGIFRQLGANHQLLASHVGWLGVGGIPGLEPAIRAATSISATAKAMQFKVARIASRRRFDPCEAMFDSLQQDYATVMECLDRAFV